MKKMIVVLLLLTCAGVSQAQFLRGFGIKAGGTFANQVWDYTGDFNFDPDNKLGLNVGVFAEFLDIPALSVVGELNYVQKKVEESFQETTESQPDGTGRFFTFDLGNEYINLSLLAKFRLDMLVVAPYIVAGPKMDFALSDIDPIISFDMEKTIPGFKLGVGAELDLKVIHLLAEFIYDYNLLSLYEGEYLEVKSNSYDFRIGIYL